MLLDIPKDNAFGKPPVKLQLLMSSQRGGMIVSHPQEVNICVTVYIGCV